LKHFRFSLVFAFFCLGLSFYWGYVQGGYLIAANTLGVAFILAIMETSLSFDNAVVNASILKNWNAFWQKIFLTIGILIAVFGMRLVFPIVIVASAASIGISDVWNLAVNSPLEFSKILKNHHQEVAVFGGVFLLLVSLNFLMDFNKKIHWLNYLEKKLAYLGKFSNFSVLISMLIVVLIVGTIETEKKAVVLIWGISGVIIYLATDLLSKFLESDGENSNNANLTKIAKTGTIGSFLYLEVLDASFSFDGVIGAFAITSDVVIIMLGLAIGAMFVRSMTIYLVKQGTLDEYVYLEHGAHYAIGVLAIIMFLSTSYHVPEIITGLIGVLIIGASLKSSIKYNNNIT